MERTQTPTLRRNGKRPSCEPCRKSKLSCDHVTPICGRCQRRGISDKCTYHPAPMTGMRPKSNQGHESRKSLTPVRTNSFLPSPLTSNPDKSRKSIPTIQPQPGFLGSTSYAAVFTESQTQIGLDADQDNGELQHTHSDPTASSLGKDALIKQGAAVLALLSDFPLYGPFIDQWLDYARGLALIAPFMPECMASIKRDLYDPFVKAQSGRALLHASEMLFTNGAKPMKMDPGMTFRQYHTLFTGENLRWEALGMLFTAVGLSCLIMLAADTTVDSPQTGTFDKRTLAHRMLEASDASIAFCEQTGHLNDPGMWLIYENFLLMSLAIGDSSYRTWRRLGDLSTTIFALGLHQEIKVSPDVPFWLAEIRKRCFAITYAVDKLMATFVGRPPRISRRYCSIQVPLDIDVADLALPEDALNAKISQLDANGWRHDGTMRRSAYMRTFLITSRVREDILEISLGPDSEYTFELGQEIARRNLESWESFPESVRYYPAIWNSDRRREECFFTVIIYLDLIYNDFLLQRTLVRRIRARSDEMLRISRLLMTTLLDVIGNRASLRSSSCEIPWMVAIYGLPSAGVLALELLQQSQSRSHTHSHHQPKSTSFPRSEVIQNLSVFVACLGSIHTEGDGNHNLCIQARRMLQRILDTVLSPQEAPATQLNVQSLLTPASTDYSAGESGGEGMFDFSWMDNAEFDADFWMNLPDHPLLMGSENITQSMPTFMGAV